MARKGIPLARVISADDEGVEAAARSMATAIAGLRPGETLLDFAARGPQIIRENVAAISEAVEEADAFDVIELMRLRETPLVLDGYRESLADQRPAAVELIALVLLARGERTPEGADTRKANPASEIPDFHDRCGTMLSLGQFMLLSEGRDDKYGPLTTLAATYVGHDINVKFKQYAHMHDGMNEALFGTEYIGDLLLGSLGFSYENFVAVRTAIREVYLDRLFAARDTLGEIAQEWSDSGRADQPEDRIEQGRVAVHDLGRVAKPAGEPVEGRGEAEAGVVVAGGLV